MALAACTQLGLAQPANKFHRTLPISAGTPVILDVRLREGELQIFYGRDQEVSVVVIGQVAADAKVDDEFLAATPTIEQDGNHLKVRYQNQTGLGERQFNTTCKISVPYWTEVRSAVDVGKQTISGIMGPVNALTNRGDIKVSYISKSLRAQAGSGNLDLQVIGEHVEAKTGKGNIACIRAAQGVGAETEDGDILLTVVGPSEATVKTGIGRIDVGGARGSLRGSTKDGDLHVKAAPHDDWQLESAAGQIRLELPPAASFEIDAATNSGELLVSRDDTERPDVKARHFDQKVNGGGKHIRIRTDSGKIFIQ